MKILINGDSWGCGEWSHDRGKSTSPLHTGLEQYIKDCGHQVWNISVGGSSNYQIANRLNLWLDRHPDEILDHILIFQTDPIRDSAMLFLKDFDQITCADSLLNIWISRFYSRLSEISQKSNCPIILIGGISDTLWLTNMEIHYPGVSVACQSMVNLILNNTHRVDQPVISWYDRDSIGVITRIKKELSQAEIAKLLKQVDLGMQRQDRVFGSPEYFWPDGKHPNRLGHKILFDFLKTQIPNL